MNDEEKINQDNCTEESNDKDSENNKDINFNSKGNAKNHYNDNICSKKTIQTRKFKKNTAIFYAELLSKIIKN